MELSPVVGGGASFKLIVVADSVLDTCMSEIILSSGFAGLPLNAAMSLYTEALF